MLIDIKDRLSGFSLLLRELKSLTGGANGYEIELKSWHDAEKSEFIHKLKFATPEIYWRGSPEFARCTGWPEQIKLLSKASEHRLVCQAKNKSQSVEIHLEVTEPRNGEWFAEIQGKVQCQAGHKNDHIVYINHLIRVDFKPLVTGPKLLPAE